MQADFANSLARVLVYEGGKVDNPKDPGGRTNKGITQATFYAYLRSAGQLTRDVYTISDAEVATIYRDHYWAVVHGDALPAGLDLVVFDGGVNSGPGQSGKWLQHALGSHYAGAVDGLIGTKTLQAIEDFGNVETLIGDYCARRLATLHQLTTWQEFGTGWSARVANVLKTGDAWAAGSADAPHPVDVTSLGGHQKARVSDLKVSKVSQVATHVTTIGTTSAAIATNAATNLAPVQQALPHLTWFAYILGGLAGFSAVATFIVKLMADITRAAGEGSATAAVNLDADADLPQVVTDTTVTPGA